MLRKTLNCKLPIELYHFPDEMQDEEIRRAFVDEFDVELKVVSVFGWRVRGTSTFD
jgi:hypothetical protein